MKSRVSIAVYLITTFFITTIAIAFYHYRQFPALAVAVEESPATWLSGMLLSCGAGIALVITMHRGWNPWALLVMFLFLLAADEYFMLHERSKQWIAFNFNSQILLIREMPVFIGAAFGCWISWTLWRSMTGAARWLLIAAFFFGVISVTLDVIYASALWEEMMKLIAELAIVCALLITAKNYRATVH
jgi:uncharacterized membrane protein